MKDTQIFDELEQVQDKQKFECLVGAYQIGHSHMTILARKHSSQTRNNFYMIFQSLYYFSGPFKWMGIDLTLGTKTDCCDILTQADLLSDYEKCLDHLYPRLYVFQTSNIPVRIIAGGAWIIEEEK